MEFIKEFRARPLVAVDSRLNLFNPPFTRLGQNSGMKAEPHSYLRILIAGGKPGNVRLLRTPAVRYHRPSVDLLFESVAASYKERAIGVVLSGSGSDGAMGVEAINKMGGTVLAQDKETAEFFGMPGAAAGTGCVDFVLPLDQIAPALVTLVVGGANNAR